MFHIEHSPRARVHHDKAHLAEVPVEAPAGAGDLAVGLVGELAQDAGSVGRLPHPPEELVLIELVWGEVAEVLVDPVRHESPDDSLLPPGLRPHLPHPRLRGVPVVVDVVVVEDHGRRNCREEPPYNRVLPGVQVEVSVLLEVRYLFVAWRLIGISPRADVVAGALGDLVSVDLISEKHQRVGPLLPGLALPPEGQRVQGVPLVASSDPARELAPLFRVRQLVRDRDSAGAKGQGELVVRDDGPDNWRWERRTGLRPYLLAVQAYPVLVG